MTTDDLAVFSELLRKVDRIGDAQIITNERLESIETSLTTHSERFERIENILLDNSKIMIRMLDRMESMENRQEKFEGYLNEFAKRFDRLETTMGKVSEALSRLIDFNESFAHLDQRVMQLENARLLQRLARLEKIILKES
jgi:predicted  nucleic acid-binding Zn-ribbon protein